jgi:hypothetical protein
MRAVIVAATTLLVGSLTDAGAAMVEFERTNVHVTVAASGRVEFAEPSLGFEFHSDVQFGPRTPPVGGINVLLGDGSVRMYQAVGATLLSGDQCLVFFLGGVPGELDPSDLAIAIVRDAPGVVFFKLQIKQVFPQPVEFAVPGEIRFARSGPRPEATGVWFSLHYPRRDVALDQAAITAGFAARVVVSSDHNGWGSIELALPGEPSPLLFEPVFGVALPETGTRPGYIVILTVRADAPLQMENLGVVTVHPDPALPGEETIDLPADVIIDNAPLHVTFNAEGRTRFYGQKTVR